MAACKSAAALLAAVAAASLDAWLRPSVTASRAAVPETATAYVASNASFSLASIAASVAVSLLLAAVVAVLAAVLAAVMAALTVVVSAAVSLPAVAASV